MIYLNVFIHIVHGEVMSLEELADAASGPQIPKIPVGMVALEHLGDEAPASVATSASGPIG